MISQIRQQFGTFWDKQSKAQRIVLVTLVATGMVLIPLFLVWANTPSYAVAYSGLSETDAGVIVEKLNENTIPYQLRSSGTILVPSDQVYDVRLMMAREGLPEGGSVGFELFNGNTLGMTEFTQRVNYQQALEGELERTIGSLNAVDAVLVHVVTPERSLLASEQLPTTASITIKEKPAERLDAAQVRSITHLVASAVEGLKPEEVVVVDVSGNLLASGETNGESSAAAQTDNRRAAEIAAGRELQMKVQDILDKALGPNKSVVRANVSMDWTERETTTQSYDPAAAALRSAQNVMETYTTTNASLAGVPGAVSNLPPANTGVVPENQSVYYTRTEQTSNYELTQVQSHEVVMPGQITRVSLSVLVDGVTDPNRLEALKSVIGAAAGIDAQRGDMLAVETLAFDRTYYEAQAVDLESGERTDLYIKIGTGVAAGIILLLLLWYIQRLLTKLKLASAEAWKPVLYPVGEMALSGAGYALQQIPGAAEKPQILQRAQIQEAAPPLPEPKPERRALPPRPQTPTITPEEEQLQNLIRSMAENNPSNLASIVQIWLSEDDRENG
jgi:flagellar M-ring protein FliF